MLAQSQLDYMRMVELKMQPKNLTIDDVETIETLFMGRSKEFRRTIFIGTFPDKNRQRNSKEDKMVRNAP